MGDEFHVVEVEKHEGIFEMMEYYNGHYHADFMRETTMLHGDASVLLPNIADRSYVHFPDNPVPVHAALDVLKPGGEAVIVIDDTIPDFIEKLPLSTYSRVEIFTSAKQYKPLLMNYTYIETGRWSFPVFTIREFFKAAHIIK